MKTDTQMARPSHRRRVLAAIQLQDPVWWCLAAIAALLAADLAGLQGAHETAIAIAACLALTALLDDRTPKRFRSQVRIVYLCVMALSFIPAMGLLVWIQMIGTFVLVLTGYCPLARVMALLPGNRSAGLSWDLMRHVMLYPVTTGSIAEELGSHRPTSLQGPAF
ncbi:hypothetical protein AB0T83_15200 [Fluviibacterium sp. DFM31]|uniref:Uncharacterized protein n=1 Tax=Meridianimarinicoccus marinus TaxID=3231483 RepID=A0ABV3L9B2_9RHOB